MPCHAADRCRIHRPDIVFDLSSGDHPPRPHHHLDHPPPLTVILAHPGLPCTMLLLFTYSPHYPVPPLPSPPLLSSLTHLAATSSSDVFDEAGEAWVGVDALIRNAVGQPDRTHGLARGRRKVADTCDKTAHVYLTPMMAVISATGLVMQTVIVVAVMVMVSSPKRGKATTDSNPSDAFSPLRIKMRLQDKAHRHGHVMQRPLSSWISREPMPTPYIPDSHIFLNFGQIVREPAICLFGRRFDHP